MQLSQLLDYLKVMNNAYTTLRTLAAIALEEPNPVQYVCTPREMILHSTFDWDLINKQLLYLQDEGLVKIVKADTYLYSITQKGLDTIASMEPVESKVLTVSFRDDAIAK
jgi:predicted transcriptional regulator